MYTPQGPLMSPLTGSFFTNWGQNDMGFELGREMLTIISIAVAKKLGMHASFIELANNMFASRCGIYQHLGTIVDTIEFLELWTNEEIQAVNATGYNGHLGEIFYTRILPPNNIRDGVHVNFNTPYVMHKNTYKTHWLATHERVLAKAEGHNPEQDF